jgi:transglutaminase-like putative cysteine protease
VNLTGGAFNTAGSLLTIPGGDAGVRRTLRLMVDLVDVYKCDLNVREHALALVAACAPKDRTAEAQSLQRYCRDSIRYVGDVDGVETLQTPVQTLRLAAGDCDDKATLLCSLAASIGFSTRFCAIGVRDEEFSHVMAQLRLGRGWVNAETIMPGVEIGWWPPDTTKVMLAHC